MNEVQKMRKLTGLSQSKFANHFGIPVCTIRQWERNGARPSKYLLVMMARILKYEGILSESDIKWCFNNEVNYSINQN